MAVSLKLMQISISLFGSQQNTIKKLSDKIRIILSKYELSRNVPETGIIPATTIADKITKF